MAQGISGQTFPFIYHLMRERFHQLPDMLLLWRNYIDIQCAVLKVLIEMATIQMSTSSATELAHDFYEVCLQSMKTFLEHQGQRLEKIFVEDEEQPDDVLMFVELFKKLTIQYIFEPAGEKRDLLMILKIYNWIFCRAFDGNEIGDSHFIFVDAKNVSDSSTIPRHSNDVLQVSQLFHRTYCLQ